MRFQKTVRRTIPGYRPPIATRRARPAQACAVMTNVIMLLTEDQARLLAFRPSVGAGHDDSARWPW
jgi:hypothetical protein